MFQACTGVAGCPDATFNQTAPVTLIPDLAVPSGLRCYLTRADLDVRGNAAWTGGTYLAITDTNSAPMVYLPTNALRGMSTYTFPDSDTEIPIVATASSFAAATGVITFGSSVLVNAAYANGNCVLSVISGTGAGQSAFIASNTATTVTSVGGASAFPVALDNTSVIAVWYWAATAGSTTSATFSNAAFAVNVLDNGFNVIAVSSAQSPGSVRPIISNSATAVTVPAAQPFQGTGIAAGDLIHLSNEQNLFGALDLCVGDKYAAAGTGRGLQVVVGGTMTAGSPVRVYVEGFFAA